MAKAEITNQEFAAEYTKGIDFGPGAEPSPDVVDDKAAAWKEYTGGDDVALGGNEFDSATNSYKNRTPRDARDGKGRFQAVRESLERSQKRSDYVRSVLEGGVEPDESTMDADTWAAARNAQIARGTNRITAPEFPAERSADGATANNTAEQELTPAEQAHFEAHDSFMSSVAAKIAIDPETRTARDGFAAALEKGTAPEAMKYLGHCIADTDNPHEVFLALGKNPEAVDLYSRLKPEGMRSAVLALSRELASRNTHAKAAPAPKPKPPDPVGARASATAFDVNDESIDADTWARQRNEQLAKRWRR
jgi:hypothetical protein